MGTRLTTTFVFGGSLLLLPLSAGADADSLVDQLGPREVAVGEAMRAGATGASSRARAAPVACATAWRTREPRAMRCTVTAAFSILEIP